MSSNQDLIKNYLAETTVTKFRIVAWGASDYAVKQTAASTDKSIGVVEAFSAAAGERVDVVRSGLTPVEYGSAVTRGDPLTSDAQGRAVVAAPGAGVTAVVIGFAEVSGVAGDIGFVNVVPQYIKG